MKFSKVLPLLFKTLRSQKVDFALIGGIALHTYGLARTTMDADFMILLSSADQVDEIMKSFGYKLLHQTKTFANYLAADPDYGRVDFMYAGKEVSVAMLARAQEQWLLGEMVKVLQAEDLIGLKVLSSSNDSERATRDLSDIEDLMRRYHRNLDWKLVENYFNMFGRGIEFRQLRKRTK